MAKLGRPFTYLGEEERPVTVSLRIPRDLAERMKRYALRHRQSVTELLLDGLKWRLEQEDPRQQSTESIKYYDNTVLQELEKPLHFLDEAIPFDEDLGAGGEAKPQDLPDISHYDNTVIQNNVSQSRGRPSSMREPILDLLRSHPEGLSATELKVHLRAEKNLGDTLQGMVRAGVLKGVGSGQQKKYCIA